MLHHQHTQPLQKSYKPCQGSLLCNNGISPVSLFFNEPCGEEENDRAQGETNIIEIFLTKGISCGHARREEKKEMEGERASAPFWSRLLGGWSENSEPFNTNKHWIGLY